MFCTFLNTIFFTNFILNAINIMYLLGFWIHVCMIIPTCPSITFNHIFLPDSGSGDLPDLGVHQFTLKGSSQPVTFKVTRGDYSPLMQHLAENLAKAKVCDLLLIETRNVLSVSGKINSL